MSDGAVERLRRNLLLIRSMFGLHPRLFAASFAGATIFAIATVASSFALRWAIDNVIRPRFEDGAVSAGAVIVGVALITGIGILRSIGVVIRRAYASAGMWRVAQSYTDQVVDRLIAQPIEWYRRRSDGDLVARAGVDADTAVSVIAPIPLTTSTILIVIVSTIWLFLIDIPLGIVALVLFPLIIVSNVVYERSVTDVYSRAQEELGVFSANVHESFEGVQLVKAYGAEARETARLSALANRVRESRVEAIGTRSWFDAITDMIPSFANIVLVLLGAARVESSNVTVGEFSSVIFLFTLLAFPLRLIGYTLSELPRSMSAWSRIQEIVTEPIAPDPVASIGRPPVEYGIALDRVSYTYEGASAPAVSDISLAVRTGSITALVGPTGAGKSTLADLVVGLTSPSSGTVELAEGQRCVVLQEAFLVAGNIRENIAFGAEVTDEEIWSAARIAVADGFIAELPDALDTVVGERGVSLSGGQRQRVALARALVRRPSIMVLDDTTSALDPTTEALVLDGLRSTLDATVLLIASRPSTIALADDVIFLADGKIVAHATHEELLETVAEYRQIVEAFEADRRSES